MQVPLTLVKLTLLLESYWLKHGRVVDITLIPPDPLNVKPARFGEVPEQVKSKARLGQRRKDQGETSRRSLLHVHPDWGSRGCFHLLFFFNVAFGVDAKYQSVKKFIMAKT
jgi:hypothetical protein